MIQSSADSIRFLSSKRFVINKLGYFLLTNKLFVVNGLHNEIIIETRLLKT